MNHQSVHVDGKQCKQHIIRLDYIALVPLVAWVDAEQQTQWRAIYPVQKTTECY